MTRPASEPASVQAQRMRHRAIATVRPLYAVIERDIAKLVRQRGRLLAQMLRPLIWLFVIGGGFGAVMARHGVSGYQLFLVPGVLGMTILFGAMLGALSTVYDKESGVMRLLVIAPVPHVWVVLAKTLAAAIAAMAQGTLLLALLLAFGYIGRTVSVVLLVAGMAGTSLVCAAMGITVATFSRTLENYAVMMNVVIFPVYFLSGALYPVDMLPTYLALPAMLNPFTYGVDVVKHATLVAEGNGGFGRPEFGLAVDFAAIVGFTLVALVAACARFSRGYACEALVHPWVGHGARSRAL